MSKTEELSQFVKKQWQVKGDPIEVFWPQATAKRKELKLSQDTLFEVVDETIFNAK